MTIKHIWGGAAIAAVLAIAAPTWAQNPSAGNGMGLPGPNPGGGGNLSPYSGGGYPAAGTAAAPSSAASAAMPPSHHAVRHAKAMHAFHSGRARKAALTGDTTAQLNREELARIQSGGAPAPSPAAPMAAPPPAAPNPSGGNAMGMPGPNPGGGGGLTPYSTGAPPH